MNTLLLVYETIFVLVFTLYRNLTKEFIIDDIEIYIIHLQWISNQSALQV